MNRMRRMLPPVIAAALLALALPAIASANYYCVHASCPGTDVDTIEDAFLQAQKSDDADRVFLGDWHYWAKTAAGFVYGGGGPIEIIGAGEGRSILTAPSGNGGVLTLQGGAGSSVHDLTISMPSFATGYALYTLNDARGGGPATDTQSPLITGFRASPPVFAIARARTPVAARTARGTWLRYSLSEPARVRISVKRAIKRDGHLRYHTVGSLRRTGAQGANTIRFTGRIGKRALRPGRFRAVIRATDTAGNRGAARTIRLRVTRR